MGNMSEQIASLGLAIDQLLKSNIERRSRFDHTRTQDQYIRELCTVAVNAGRQAGHTSWWQSRIDETMIVLTINQMMAHYGHDEQLDYAKRTGGYASDRSQIIGFRGRHSPIDETILAARAKIVVIDGFSVFNEGVKDLLKRVRHVLAANVDIDTTYVLLQ